ncbi:MAG: methionine aminotransferase [Chitinophagaceae bacterium]
MHIPQKHQAAGTTIFTVMSALAAQYNAINLSQGFPDFSIDERLIDLVNAAMKSGANQYAPMAGLAALREAISADFRKRYELDIDADSEITITPGATYAIYTAFNTILEVGDEVIVLEPAYDSYIPNIQMCGARAVPVPLLAPDFCPDWNKIKAAINPRTKAIIVNTPNNPTGAIWTKEDWNTLAEILKDTSIFVLSDEVYEQLVYDGAKHESVLENPFLRARAFVLFSFGKVFHATGWKMGYCIAPALLTAAFRRLHQFIAFSVNTPMQAGIAAYINLPERLPVNAFLQQKRDLFLNLMRATPFKISKPAAGSYFQVASYEGLSELGDKAFAEWLTKEYQVATIPVSAFYSDGQDQKLLRFCFAKKEETLREAVEKLSKL